MIIGIDAREGVRAQRAGKGEYVYQLVNQIIHHDEHKFILFVDGNPPHQWQRANVRIINFPTGAWLWQFLMFWYLEILRPVDVYLSTTSLILPALVRSVPVITALMDFVSFLFPASQTKKTVILERMWMRPALIYSRHLIAISKHTKADATKLFGTNPDKISVVYLAPGLTQPAADYPLPEGKIILSVGTLEPRKNIERLVAAFDQVKLAVPEAILVVVGRWGWHSDKIRQALAASPWQKDIKILLEVNDAQKISIYQQAQVLVFPSLYEGFGLPPLEAMALGVPVVTSNRASLPEVVGDAALVVDPTSTTEIAQAIQQILQNPGLAQDLVIRGLARAELFTWAKTANLTLQVLLKVKP